MKQWQVIAAIAKTISKAEKEMGRELTDKEKQNLIKTLYKLYGVK